MSITAASQTAAPAPSQEAGGWRVLRGPVTARELSAALQQLATAQDWRACPDGSSAILITSHAGAVLAAVRWRPGTPPRPGTLSHVLAPGQHLEILIDPRPGAEDAASLAAAALAPLTLRLSPAEMAGLTASMPLTTKFAATAQGTRFDGQWALIFRDHYVEHSLGFILAVGTAGIPPEWTLSLAKGDKTSNRDRIHATLTARGIRSGVMDNTAINAPATHATDLARSLETVDDFIDAARASGRRVLVIDDGGLIAQGYGHAAAPRQVDAAVELTVSGLKRIAAAGPLAIPVFNMARSQLKTRLGYPEIADSCLRRLRQLVPARKFIGRPVVVLGFGTLGSRLASALAGLGCQVHVVDTNPLALIVAAESGHPAHRTAADALRAVEPFLVAGTTGYDALTPVDLRLLPDGCLLAPFATRDFALLAEPGISTATTEIPGIGRKHHLAAGPSITLLGDGRSLNLFEADSIPNQGYDAYRAGTLIAAAALCQQAGNLPPGVHTSLVDDIIAGSGLYDAYYDTYLAVSRPRSPQDPGRGGALVGAVACVIGYGTAGQLHAGILATEGAEITVIDPKHQDLPRAGQEFRAAIDDLPTVLASGIALWSVCCPTADHLPSLRAILARDPRARVLLEKPACQAHEIRDLTALLAAHTAARVTVIDQYQHSTVLPELARLIAATEPGRPIDRITCTFAKDRTADIARGRFIDRSYGVLGYEWLHMLAAIRHLIPPAAFTAYLSSAPDEAEFQPAYDDRLFISALAEHASVTIDGAPCRLDLASTITGQFPGHPRDGEPAASVVTPARIITAHAGETLFTARLAPATGPDGRQLPLNHHLITAERVGQVTHEQVITDSPMHTAIRHATRTLLSAAPTQPLDLSALRRIAAIAAALRTSREHGRT
jgi:S-adenosylhomocysteine hydrolase